ncbi:guanosine polyphosphate synthetase/pyrophosphohydrolase [Lachnospiraceae bacterium JC7]|nr:guanosine polyphosphate synthetase/pyrophosphohydrolase [Lachnospiraceae bacterium JC7]
MMNMLEEAIIYATVLHQGKIRKFKNIPYILHPIEVAQILSTMTDDQEIITAGILHDIVEDTDGTLEEIKKRFGDRVAFLVSSESENKYPDEDPGETWKRRKEEALQVLRNSRDIGVKMLWLADKLANIRSLSGMYSEMGESMWTGFHQGDPQLQCWYYRTIAEIVELSLNKTGAFKEYIKHVNFIWPGTFDSEKARYKKYREVSIDGCKLIGKGAKGEVYRYDDELVIKVFNENNTYRDVEQEIALSRKTFVLGMPTAISFGIVSVGDRYGAMYELIASETISGCISRDPSQVDTYARVMAELAHTIHDIEVTEEDGFSDATENLRDYIRGGIAYDDEALAERCMKLIGTLPDPTTLIHGDFHTGNVFMQNGEALLIDMDRVSRGNPIIEIAGLHHFYVALGENDPSVVEKFMGFSYQTSRRFFETFLKIYFDTEDESVLGKIRDKAAFISYIRMVRKIHKHVELTEKEKSIAKMCMERVEELLGRLDTLEI